MGTKASVLLSLLLVAVAASLAAVDGSVPRSFNRTHFPKDFLFGASGSAYQYEGAPNKRGQTIWDVFARDFKSKISDGSNGDIANGFYFHHKEDVQLMKSMGLNSFRFSISWARIFPNGKLSGGVNQVGVDFYNNLINELVANGITPFATLHHFDTPQALEKEYGSFLSDKLVNDFGDYAEFCYKTFGDRVKHWITFNEPNVFIMQGYDLGTMAPGRCSQWRNNNCPAGDSATEPYIVAHNLLLSHAEAVKRYKTKYQASQKGQIGLTLVVGGMYPASSIDSLASKRVQDFYSGWFLHPIVYGDYPRRMKFLVRKRLPGFTAAQSKMLMGSYDFVGVNYYSSYYVTRVPFSNKPAHPSYSSDYYASLGTTKGGTSIGPLLGTLHSVPRGLTDILHYLKNFYKDPVIYITENGTGQYNNQTTEEGVKDPYRVEYYHTHLLALEQAIREGARVKGFLAWSLLDAYEWGSGYTVRYGINYVDYKNLKRYPKNSAEWYKKFLLK